MAGFKGAPSTPQPGASTQAERAALQQYLWCEAHRRQAAAPPALPKAEAALGELLRGQSFSGGGSDANEVGAGGS
eukprot:9188602-Pyramimonas_sp.AAC.1